MRFTPPAKATEHSHPGLGAIGVGPTYYHRLFTPRQIRAARTQLNRGIAAAEGTSKRRVQQMIDLAFLAPDIVRDVLDGKQPIGFTSDWCLRHEIPSDWSKQRAIVASL